MDEGRAHGAHAVDVGDILESTGSSGESSRESAGSPAEPSTEQAGSPGRPSGERAESSGESSRESDGELRGEVGLRYGFGTDIGLIRELNEDSYIAVQPVFAVADGMGGHEAGEVASTICVRTLGASRMLDSTAPHVSVDDLEELIEQIDERIRSEAGGDAGTTLTGVVLVEESERLSWLFFNVGDSRAYRLNDDMFGQISVDHSEVQELVDLGQLTADQARTHPRRHVVTRALGTGDDTEADFWLLPVEPGDRLLLCSDGLTGEITDDEICRILRTVGHPQEACDQLIGAALRSGARDNVSVIVVDAVQPGAALDPAALDLPASGVQHSGWTTPVRGFFAADGRGEPEEWGR